MSQERPDKLHPDRAEKIAEALELIAQVEDALKDGADPEPEWATQARERLENILGADREQAIRWFQ